MSTVNKTKKILFEDFEAGQVYELGSKTLSHERILAFAEEFDPQPFHVDEEAAKASIYGGLIASGWHSGSVLMGMLATDLLNHSSSQGSPGLDELKWHQPVYPGTTLNGRATVLATRESRSRPGIGFVQIRSELYDHEEQPVLSMVSWLMIDKRPSSDAEN